jgi:hypothetical protein
MDESFQMEVSSWEIIYKWRIFKPRLITGSKQWEFLMTALKNHQHVFI